MIKRLFLIFLCLDGINLYSQEIIISAIIVDSLTQEALPYSTIEINNGGGTVSNQSGFFKFKIHPKRIRDSCRFSNIAYHSKQFLIQDLLSRDTFVLLPKTYELPILEIHEKPSFKSQEIGVLAQSPNAAYGMKQWMQIALEFDGSKYKGKSIETVHFYIFPSKKQATPFRVRIYENNQNGAPGNDLLIEQLVVQAKSSGWLSVALKSPIKLPETLFFIAMEWINTGEKHTYKKKILGVRRTYYGQQLGNIIKEKSPRTWIKLIGKEWKKDDQTIANGELGYRNAMIKMSIY